MPEFLFARIAEDRAEVQKILDHFEGSPRYRAGMTDVEKLLALEDEDGIGWWGEYIHLSISPVRFLAECEMKQAIVKECVEKRDLYEILQLLATPYVKHPDFQEEWNRD